MIEFGIVFSHNFRGLNIHTTFIFYTNIFAGSKLNGLQLKWTALLWICSLIIYAFFVIFWKISPSKFCHQFLIDYLGWGHELIKELLVWTIIIAILLLSFFKIVLIHHIILFNKIIISIKYRLRILLDRWDFRKTMVQSILIIFKIIDSIQNRREHIWWLARKTHFNCILTHFLI